MEQIGLRIVNLMEGLLLHAVLFTFVVAIKYVVVSHSKLRVGHIVLLLVVHLHMDVVVTLFAVVKILVNVKLTMLQIVHVILSVLVINSVLVTQVMRLGLQQLVPVINSVLVRRMKLELQQLALVINSVPVIQVMRRE